jgi:hypothetical protein
MLTKLCNYTVARDPGNAINVWCLNMPPPYVLTLMGIKVLYCLNNRRLEGVHRQRSSLLTITMSRNVAGTLEVSNLSRADSVALAGTIESHCRSERISVILADAIGAAGLPNELQLLL